MVEKGWAATETWAPVRALKSEDFPALARPTRPRRCTRRTLQGPPEGPLGWPPYVQAHQQAQAAQEEQGQPRQAAQRGARVAVVLGRAVHPPRPQGARFAPPQATRRSLRTRINSVGTSEMIPSTPKSTSRCMDSVSLTVHTWTATPDRWAASTNR